MATTIYTNGRVIATPGSYSEVDASGLEQIGLGASGIVAIVGSAEGGVPASAFSRGDQLVGITTPDRVRRTFRSGDLREACSMIFEPSRDPQITAGPQVVVPVKVNPATQGSTTLSNSAGSALTVTSQNYGAFVSQINIALAASSPGRLVTVSFEDTVEAVDNVGGETMFEVSYVAPATGGWETMSVQVLSDRIRALGSRTDLGLDTEIDSSNPGANAVRVEGSANNAGTVLTLYGVAGGLAVKESVVIGAADVTFTTAFTAVYGAALSAPVNTSAVVVENAINTLLINIAVGDQYEGVQLHTGFYVANSTLLFSADGATTDEIHIWGKSASGAEQSERVVLAGAAGVRSTLAWSSVDLMVLGDVAAARTVTIQGVAAETLHSTQSTLQKVVDHFNARQIPGGTIRGFVAALVDGDTTFGASRLDLTASATGANCFNVDAAFTADLDALVTALNTSSSLVTASRITFAPQIRTLSYTVTNATTYTATINSVACSYTSDGSATAAEIQAGLIAAVNNNPTVSSYVAATAGATSTTVVLTALTPNTFTLTGTNVTIALTQNLAGVGQMPNNTTAGSPQFLAGGTEGTATFSDWQHALNLLRQRRVNTIVVLTGDPAIHAELEAHCAYMCGIGRSERDGIIGLSALDGNDDPLNTLPSLTSIKSQIRNLNSRHLRAFAQSIDRFNTSGERTTYLPWFLGVLAAGMQAGSSVGTSLTNKYVNVLGHAQSSTWNTVENGEELIQSGLCFIEEVPAIGRRFVRNVTTYLSSNNLAYSEASVNESVNYAVYEFRTELESIVGRQGTVSNVNALKGIAANKLAQLQTNNVIVAWRALSVVLNGDVLEVSVELAPVIPVNFVRSTIHLNTLPITAA